MLSVTSATRVLVATTPVDLRGSFNRLYGLVVEQLKSDPLSGHLFVFTNSRQLEQISIGSNLGFSFQLLSRTSIMRSVWAQMPESMPWPPGSFST